MRLAELNERQRSPGKFQGERKAVEIAWLQALDGFAFDDFGDTEGEGYFARVFIPCEDITGGELIVCFMTENQGFVIEITNEVYEAAWADWVEACERDAA